MKQHGILAPSDSNAWYKCTGKPAMEKLLRDKGLVFDYSNPLSDRGNLLHDVAKFTLHGLEHPAVLGQDDRESVDTYVNYVNNLMDLDNGRKQLFVEHRVSFAEYTGFSDQAFGTADAIVFNYDTKTMDIIDYKAGRVPVKAFENSQLKLYAVGAYSSFSLVEDIEKIRLTIVQPMLHSIDSVIYTADEILDFASTLAEKAAAVFKQLQKQEDGAGQDSLDLTSGSHCLYCRCAPFCKRFNKATLGALVENNIVISDALSNIETNTTPTAEMLANALDILPMVEQWCTNVVSTANKYLSEHRSIPRYTVVKGRKGNRHWVDCLKVVEKLKSYGYDDDDIFTPMVVKSVTQIEKLLPKDKPYWEELQDLIARTSGKEYWKRDDQIEPELPDETELQFLNLTGVN